jgi:transcriptional regulator with XRE-family HTH domain
MSPEEENATEEVTPGARLGQLLKELRYSQTAVAGKCGVSPQYVNNIVRGRQRLTEDFAQALAEALDVNLNWLYMGRGPMLWEEMAEQRPAGDILATDLRSAADSLEHAANRLSKRRRERAKQRQAR